MIQFDKNDIFIVTGASSGIGRAISLRLNELGASIIAVGRSLNRLTSKPGSIKYKDRYFPEVRNLSGDMGDLPDWIYDLSKKYGKLKGIILSAGVQQIVPLKALDIKRAQEVFDLNYFSPLFLAKGFADKRVNLGRGSSILFISSIAAVTGNRGIINYSASKGAVNSAVKSMALELSTEGIRVNAVLPGFVMSEMIEKWSDIYNKDYIEQLDSKYPLGIGKSESVADICCFLVSDSAGWITGQCFIVDGGGSLV